MKRKRRPITTDRKYLIMKIKREGRYLRGHEKIPKRNLLGRYLKQNFSQRSRDTWSGLKEMIMAKNIQQLKEKLDKDRYGDGTTRAYLRPYILGKYNLQVNTPPPPLM